MNYRDSIACASRADIKNYLYFIFSTGLFQTYSGWVKHGRPNPLVTKTTRKQPTSRAELVALFRLKPMD